MRIPHLLAALGLATGLAASPAAHAGDKTNVILIMWDAARPDHMTNYGYERDTTPVMKKFFDQGAVYEHAQSTAPWTVPSMAGVFTGLYSHNHKCDYATEGSTLDLTTDAHTMAEAMKDAGYATGLFSAQGIYMKQEGFKQGFDRAEFLGSRKLVSTALEFVDANKDKPIFEVVYWFDPHAPYEPPPAHNLWNDASVEQPLNIHSSKTEKPGFHKHGQLNSGKDSLTDAQYQQLRNLYDGEIHANDAEFGRLISELAKRGLTTENTLFIFSADHGEGFNEHPRQRVWHDIPYETVLDVPLMMRGPGVKAGTRVKTNVRTIDIYPTVLEATGATSKHKLNGESLFPLLATPNAPNRVNLGTSHFVGAVAFVRDDQHKLIFSRRGGKPTEVYATSDHAEQTNLASDAALVASLKKKREQLIESTKIDIKETGTSAMSDEEIQALCSFGYITGPQCD